MYIYKGFNPEDNTFLVKDSTDNVTEGVTFNQLLTLMGSVLKLMGYIMRTA